MRKLRERKNIISLFTLNIIFSFALLCITANLVTSFALGDESLSISGVPCETQTLNAIAENMSGNLTYQWQYSDTIDGTYVNISGATSDSYTLPTNTYNGKYIKVIVTDSNGSYESSSTLEIGNIIDLDITNGVITIGNNGEYTYYDINSSLQTGVHVENNYYMITGSTGTDASGLGNNIRLVGDGNFNVIIDSVSIYTGTAVLGLGSPLSTANVTGSGNINLYLKGENTLKNISTSPASSCAGIEKNTNSSTLVISSWDYNYKTKSCNGTCGSVDVIGGADSAGIGGSDTIYFINGTSTSYGATANITIMSGIINANTIGSQGAGIGAGNNSRADNIRIYGGNITAIGVNNGAGIGGSGGITGHGAIGEVYIYGGTINATSNGTGASIGGGGSNTGEGGNGFVSIYGGNIIANTIGGGSSDTEIGGDATITIMGGTIKSDILGSGSSDSYGYSPATIQINGGSINSSIAGTPTNGTEQVYLTRATLYEADQLKINYDIASLNGYSTYGTNGVETNEQGILYLWLPKDVEITGAVNENTFVGSIPSSYSGVLKYNCSQYYYTVNMGISDRFRVFNDSEYNNALDGSITVPSSTLLSLYLLKNDAYSTMSVSAYKSTQEDAMEEISGFSSNNNANFLVNGDTMVWFKTIYAGISRLELDLGMGNIIIEEDEGTVATNDFRISQNGHSLSGYIGEFFITTGGKATSNKVLVNSGIANIYLDKFIAESNENIIEVRNGTVNLTYSSYDNQLISDNDYAIKVLDNGILNINSITLGSSLKLTGGTNKSAIGGTGEINITKTNGFLILTNGFGATSQIEAKNYSYTTNTNTDVLPYTLSFNPGTLVGYNRSDDNKLYLPTDIQTVTETTTFTAFGITYYNLLNNVNNSGASINANGDYEIILSDAYTIDIRRKDTKLIENTDYTFDDGTDKLTILNTDTYGNMIISATIQGTILYDAKSYSGAYDENSHTIGVELLNPIDATIKYGTSVNTYNLDNAPTYTDVGTYTIYYEISKIGYTTTTGSKTVTITKGTNEWTATLLVNSVLYGTELNPFAESKWGTPSYLYSSSFNGPYTSTKPTSVGSYYVKATVIGNDNYDTITGNAVKVVIEPFSIFMGVGRIIPQIDFTYKGTTTTLSSNDVYTMRYNLSYIPDSSNPLKLVFGKNITNGTALTLIDFTSSVPKYYYYNVSSSLNSLNLIQFKKMGANTYFEEDEVGIVTAINYQINVDLPNGFGTGDLTTTFYKGSTIIPNTITTASLTTAYNPTGSVTLGTISTSVDNNIVVPVTVNATGTKHKVLSISLLDSNGDSLVFPIGTNVTINSTEPSAIHGNIATFDLGTSNISNGNYNINIVGIESGTYKVQIDISEVDSSAVSHPLGGRLDSEISNSLTVTDPPTYGLKVTTMEGQTRNVEAGANIDLKLTYNVSEQGALTIKRVKKVDSSYNGTKTNQTFKLATSGTNFGSNINSYTTTSLNTSTDVNIRLTAPSESGTYRYFFYLGTTEIRYNIIVE